MLKTIRLITYHIKLVIFFIEFLLQWIQYKKFDLVYKIISFEREAYAKEKDLDYLKRRSFFGFLNYIWRDSISIG